MSFQIRTHRFYWLVFLVVSVLYLTLTCAFPFVYPSIETTTGFVYLVNSDGVISIPAAATGPLLCSSEETVVFKPAQKPCSPVVIFTSITTINVHVLNISSNGVIQPITDIPEVRVSEEGPRIFPKLYGVDGPLDQDVVAEVTDRGFVSSQGAPETAPSFEVGNEIESLLEVPYAEASRPAPVDDEQAEAQTMEKLIRDLPPDVDSTGRDGIDSSVLSANKTANFLQSDGTINGHHSFLLELAMDSLPERRLLTLTLEFSEGSSRSIMIYVDSSRARSEIRLLPDEEKVEQDKRRPQPNRTRRKRRRRENYALEIKFSNLLLDNPNIEAVSCPEVSESLNRLSPSFLSGIVRRLEANDLTAMIDAARGRRECFGQLNHLNPEALVSVEGVDASIEGAEGQISVRRLRKGRGLTPSTVLVRFSIKEGRRKRVKVNIRSTTGVTLSGVPVDQRTVTYSVGEESDRTVDSEKRGKDLGTTSTAVIGSSVATSVTTSVGVSVAASVSGSGKFWFLFTLIVLCLATTGGVGGATTGGSMTGAIDMLQFGQKIYLMTKLAVPNLPENFVAYGESFGWTMMDMRTFWTEEKDSSPTEEEKQAEEEGIREIEEEDEYEKLVRAVSWSGLFFVCLVILHAGFIAFFFRHKIGLPNALRFPRLELFYSYWCVPAIAGASAGLLTGTTRQRELGIIILLLFPVPLVLWHVYILIRHFFTKSPESLHVVYELKPMPKRKPSKNQGEPVPTNDNAKYEPKEAMIQEVGNNFLELFILTPLLGPPYQSGEWKTVEGPSNKFVDRYGPIFEEWRGIPSIRQNATYEVTDGGSRLNRGTYAPLNPNSRYAIDRLQVSYVFKVSGTLLNLIKMVFISCFILGADHPQSNDQAITLLTVSVIYLVFQRLFRPQCTRWNLGTAMFAELIDIGTYMSILYLINNSRAEKEEVRRNVGIFMLSLQGIGFFVKFLDQILVTLTILKNGLRDAWRWQKTQPKILDVIKEVLCQDEQYLQRKYARIWISRTLGKGLYSGIIKRDRYVPFEEMFWVHPLLAIQAKLVPKLLRREAITNRHSIETGQI